MSWRDVLPIHPAADLFPMMTVDELKALGEDIKKHGLRNPIVVWVTENEHEVLLDGRNRLDAAELVGLLAINESGQPCLRTSGGLREIQKQCYRNSKGLLCDVAPYTLAVSLNIHRRHLTAEQKRDLIAKLLKTKPERSNLQTAKIVGADDKTVASVRRGMESRSEIPSADKRVDTKGREQPAGKPKASTVPAREPTQQPRPSEPVTGQSLDEVADSVAMAPTTALTTADPGEIATLANAVRVGLASLDPVLDRIVQVGADVFWRQAGDNVRRQVESTAEFLQTLTAAAQDDVMPDIPACLDRRPKAPLASADKAKAEAV